MRFKICTVLLLLAFLNVVNCDKLVVVMLDGFRWDFVSRMTVEEVPHLKALLAGGTAVEYVQPIFPSVSFPSWTTVATGLYAESHGIVGNYMYDVTTEAEFNIETIGTAEDVTGDPMWWGKHVPLWTTATEQGIHTSVYHWSRCDVPFNGITPEKCLPYNRAAAIDIEVFEAHIAEGISDLSSGGFDLVLLYYGDIDRVSHEDGPDAATQIRVMQQVDTALGKLVSGLEEVDLLNSTNIVLVTDHGMTTMGDKNPEPIFSDDIGSIRKVVDWGPFSYVSVEDASQSEIDVIVENLRTNWPEFHIYRREDIPEHFHIKGDERVLDILAVTMGTKVIRATASAKYLPAGQAIGFISDLGMHGWDDTSPVADGYEEGEYPDMRGVFIATGPAFKRGYTHQWIKLVDEYQIFTHLLGIAAQPHNGTWERVEGMFSKGPGVLANPWVLAVTLVLLLAFRTK